MDRNLLIIQLVFLYVFVLINNVNGITTEQGDTLLEENNSTIKNVTINAIKQTTETIISTTTRRPLIPQFRLPCSCLEGQCGCCTGAVLDRFQQKICLNLTYEPDDFAISTTMTMNERVLFRNTVSGKNPPPLCVRLPRVNFIKLCVKFSNVYFASRNIHMCIKMQANWEAITLLDWSFDCIRMGASGVAVVPPEAGGGLPPAFTEVEEEIEDYDDSARNAQFFKKMHNVIFDCSLDKVNTQKPDKKLINVKKLRNGNYFLSFHNATQNEICNKTIEE